MLTTVTMFLVDFIILNTPVDRMMKLEVPMNWLEFDSLETVKHKQKKLVVEARRKEGGYGRSPTEYGNMSKSQFMLYYCWR